MLISPCYLCPLQPFLLTLRGIAPEWLHLLTLLRPHPTVFPGLGNRFFWKRANPFFLLKRAKKERKRDSLFLKERKSDSLFGALFKKANHSLAIFLKKWFALWRSFDKERKSESLFFALFVKSERANCSLLLFWKRAKEQRAKEQKIKRAIAQPCREVQTVILDWTSISIWKPDLVKVKGGACQWC